MTAEPPPPAGLRMPAEWEPHEATWIAWPHHADDWPGKFDAIPWVYADIVHHLHHGETVCVLAVGDVATRAHEVLRRRGVDLNRLRFLPFATDRVWTRDYGPLFVRDAAGRLGVTDWRFNAWAKYDNWQRDDAVAAQAAAALGLPSWRPTCRGRRVVLEGGAIDVNGDGLLLTTEECLLSPVQARNPDLSRQDIERVLGEWLGVRQVIWLGRGIAGDDTHGHVDDLARFVAPRTVVCVVED